MKNKNNYKLTKKHMQIKQEQLKFIKVTVTIFIAIFLVLIGVIVGHSINTPKEIKVSEKGTFEDGWKAAEERLIESGYIMSIEESMQYAYGEVLDLKSNGLSVMTYAESPLAEEQRPVVEVVITNDTEIVKLTERDWQEYEAEMESFFAKIEAGEEPEEEPEYFTREHISLYDINIGDYVMVNTLEDVRTSKTVTATSIEIEEYQDYYDDFDY